VIPSVCSDVTSVTSGASVPVYDEGLSGATEQVSDVRFCRERHAVLRSRDMTEVTRRLDTGYPQQLPA